MTDLSHFRAAIFDFDGVLVDSERLQAEAWEVAAREMGMKDFKVDISWTAGRMDRNIAAGLFPPPLDAQEMMRRKWAVQDRMEAAGQLKPIAGSIELLRRLSKRHALAIASSTWPVKVERWLSENSLTELFCAVVACGDSIACKPLPDCYQRALATLKVRPDEACAIEDSFTGIAAAKAAGVFAIQLFHPYMQRCTDADAVIESFDEVT